MSLMSKLLISTLLASVALSANAQPTKEVLLNYVKKAVVKNPQIKVLDVKVIEAKTDDRLKGWTILLTTMDLIFNKKSIHVPETIFYKDGLVASNLLDIKTGMNYRNEIKPTLPDSYYNDEHLLFGNKDAKHKLIIFSDPQCPFCQDTVPAILDAARDNPTKIALYYYHLPLLRIHPVSGVLTRIMHIAQKEGKTEMMNKIYALKINPKETNLKKILAEVKKQTGYVVTEAQVNAKEVKKAVKEDEEAANRMMVGGTPTIYIDGKIDKARDGYKKLVSFF